MKRVFVHPAPVPPSGFRNLAAVSWQIRACGLVSCRCRPWVRLSLQSFTSQESLHPSRGRLLPCGHPHAPACAVAALSPRVSPTPSPVSRGSCRYPPEAMGALSACEPWSGPPPGHPGPRAAGSRPTTRFIRFEALILLRRPRHRPHGFPRRSGRALLGFRPSRAFSTRPSEPDGPATP